MTDHLHPDEAAIRLALSRARPGIDAACPDLLGLAAYVDGSSSDPDVVEAHLAACAACRQAVLDARSLLATNAPLEVPETVIDAARRLVVLPEISPRSRSQAGPIWPVLRWGLAAAASFAICAVGYRIGNDLLRAREASRSSDLYSLGVLTTLSQPTFDDTITLAVFPVSNGSTEIAEVSR